MFYHKRMSGLLIGLFVVFLGGIAGAGYVYLSWQSHRTPGRPFSYADCLDGTVPTEGKRVVVYGDSLTHGTMSHNWLADLQTKYDGRFVFINQGWNGDLAWNGYQKLDQVVGCEPDVIAIFIGGNDALASFNHTWSANFVNDKQLPETPTIDWYRENLVQTIRLLQDKSDAELVLFTLTLFGEDLASPENETFEAYSRVVEQVASEFDIPVLPIHKTMRARLQEMQIKTGPGVSCSPPDWNGYKRQIKWGIVRFHFLFQSWDSIAQSRGYNMQIDCVHLNSASAGIIADLFSEWLDLRN